MVELSLVNVKIILDAITIPLGLITTYMIVFRNKHNIANLLFGIIAFLAGIVSPLSALLKEAIYPIDISIAIFFAKMIYLSIFLMTIPMLSFSVFFWRAKYKQIPRYLHIFSFIPAISLGIWLFVDNDIIELVNTSFGVNNKITSVAFTIYSVIILFFVFLLLITELRIMTNNTNQFPRLKCRMNIFTAGLAFGIITTFVSIFIFQYLYPTFFQPATIFVILTAIILSSVLGVSLSKEEKKLWHGCPKLKIEKDGSTHCINTNDGEPILIKVLDLGAIIERVQLDTEILKTGIENCANIIFSDEEGQVRCLTTHDTIIVLDEIVTKDEMELAHSMEIMQGNELCAECLYKIIAYRKEHKEKSIQEIRSFFLGIRSEEFFGLV